VGHNNNNNNNNNNNSIGMMQKQRRKNRRHVGDMPNAHGRLSSVGTTAMIASEQGELQHQV
jgi:hypothetical protein